MSLLRNYTNNSNRDPYTGVKRSTIPEYKMPAVTREDNLNSISLKKGITIAAILHPVTLGIFWLVVTILAIFGINLTLFQKPVPKVKDIEFVLVDKEETPKNKNTQFRADKNSRTGGVNDPTKPVSMPSSKPAAKPQPSSSAPAPKKPSLLNKITQTVAQKPAAKPTNVTTTQKNVTPSPTPQQAVPKPQAAKPAPPTARPSLRPEMAPKAVQKPTTSPFKIAVPSGGTKAGQYSTGPVGGSGTSNKGGTTGSGAYSPNPSLAPIGSGSGSKTGKGTGTSGKGSGTGVGSGSGSGGGNPGGGGGRPGIDAIKEPDFGPWMNELQRRIKMNWDPPKGNESKRVVLLLKIAKDGRLLSCSVSKSSGLPNADSAAINAVKLAAPFRPLPVEYKNSSVDIIFTFDYNVFKGSLY